MRRCQRWAPALLLLLLPACGQQLVEFPNSAKQDAGMPEVSVAGAPGSETFSLDVSAIDSTPGAPETSK